jgi:voltage-gated potassium channel
VSELSEHRRLVRESLLRCTGIVVVLFGAYFVLPLRGDRAWVGVLLGLAVLGATIPLAVTRLRRVLTSDRPGVEAAEALVALVSMLITGFAAVFYFMNREGEHFNGLDTRVDAVYFTVTTLATVGYGDITATSQASRLIITGQMLLNLLFVGVAVRVFLTAARRRAGERFPDETF